MDFDTKYILFPKHILLVILWNAAVEISGLIPPGSFSMFNIAG